MNTFGVGSDQWITMPALTRRVQASVVSATNFTGFPNSLALVKVDARGMDDFFHVHECKQFPYSQRVRMLCYKSYQDRGKIAMKEYLTHLFKDLTRM